MRNHEASSAVDNAKIWIGIFSWASIVIGGIALTLGILIEEGALLGLMLISAGIVGLITKALVKGFESIVIASEIYIAEHTARKQEASSTE